MFVLALTQPAPLTEEEVGRIAQDLQTTPYEARLLLSGGLPALLVTSADRERAAGMGERLRARGHGVVLLDAAHVTPAHEMVQVRRLAFDAGGLIADEARPAERLPFEDVLALVRAVHKIRTDSSEKVTELKFNPTRAMALGPMFAMQRQTTEKKKSVEEREAVLYLFRHSGERPWILAEQSANYAALGPELAPTRVVNFQRVVTRLRQSCVHAQFDDRLLQHKRIPERLAGGPSGKLLETTSSSGVDILAHVVAAWIATTRVTPYR